MDLKGLASTYLWGRTLKDEKDKMDVVSPYTTLHVHRTTRDRIRKLKGKGVSADRYINDLLDMIDLEQKGCEKDE